MDEYRIIRITDLDGNDRTDGRYPLRIGRICKKPKAVNGGHMILEYLRNRDGSDYSNKILYESVVSNVCSYDNGNIVVYTTDSIYTFEKVVNV